MARNRNKQPKIVNFPEFKAALLFVAPVKTFRHGRRVWFVMPTQAHNGAVTAANSFGLSLTFCKLSECLIVPEYPDRHGVQFTIPVRYFYAAKFNRMEPVPTFGNSPRTPGAKNKSLAMGYGAGTQVFARMARPHKKPDYVWLDEAAKIDENVTQAMVGIFAHQKLVFDIESFEKHVGEIQKYVREKK